MDEKTVCDIIDTIYNLNYKKIKLISLKHILYAEDKNYIYLNKDYKPKTKIDTKIFKILMDRYINTHLSEKRGAKMKIELKGLQGSYGVCNNFLFFTAEDGTKYKMTKNEALEIMYTLYDSLDLPFDEPDEISTIINADKSY